MTGLRRCRRAPATDPGRLRTLVPQRLPAPVRRAARRARWRPPDTRPPATPVGVKLELTHACNLRCDFCYTDSPRHTVARTPDLSDAEWLAIVDEAIALGALEARRHRRRAAAAPRPDARGHRAPRRRGRRHDAQHQRLVRRRRGRRPPGGLPRAFDVHLAGRRHVRDPRREPRRARRLGARRRRDGPAAARATSPCASCTS